MNAVRCSEKVLTEVGCGDFFDARTPYANRARLQFIYRTNTGLTAWLRYMPSFSVAAVSWFIIRRVLCSPFTALYTLNDKPRCNALQLYISEDHQVIRFIAWHIAEVEYLTLYSCHLLVSISAGERRSKYVVQTHISTTDAVTRCNLAMLLEYTNY